MGTSASSKGTPGKAPMVPSWADTDGQGSGPPPNSGRFRPFRTAMGKAVRGGGGQGGFRKALGHYARSATGGAGQGPRRFGAMLASGAALFSAINDLRNGGTGVSDTGVDLSALNGTDTDRAIQTIIDALVPDNGDADKIRTAMQMALADALVGISDFDSSRITDDVLIAMMLAYVRECVFLQVMADSASAFEKAGSANQAEDAERELHALVRAVVDQEMRPLFEGDLRTTSRAAIEAVQQRAVEGVWSEWEGYE